ncbi:hypothetical protein D9756_005458 [Leucocoprinus leucothites]|uniref:Uncharacterized protein n=1 Tax=Leucocoprinus leucothites TaxID=201217 RepID=A0A8H5FZX0_9AGAR|nr:hypothetical protein D9756_005458 [Leucoagaricus leucothites]
MLRPATRALRSSLTTLSHPRTQRCFCASRGRCFSFSSSSGSPSFQKTKHTRPDVPVILAENRCAQVTTWDLLKNPAEAFALTRAVEQKYGPVESFVFRKDFDSPSTYQTKVQVTFRNAESFDRLPVLPATFHIRGPKVQPKRSGGIGLDEIQPYILNDVEFLTAGQVSEIGREERTIDFRIQRADNAFFFPSPFRPSPIGERQRKAIGSKMLQWGGFHEMEPIDSRQPITNENLTKGNMDHVYMRRALREWAKYCGEPNPFELQPEEKTKPMSAGSTVATNEEEFKPVQPDLDDWHSDIHQPDAVQKSIEPASDKEDIQVAGKSAKSQAESDLWLKQLFPPTPRRTTPNLSIEEMSRMASSPFADLESAETDTPDSSPSTSPPSTNPSTLLDSTGTDSDVPQHSSAEAELQDAPWLQKSNGSSSDVLSDAQEDVFRPKSLAEETKEVEGASGEGSGLKESSNAGPEPGTSSRKLYDILQDIIKGS